MTTGHLITDGDLSLLCNIYTNALIDTCRKLVAGLSCKCLGVNNYSVFAVMQGKTLYVNSYNLRFEKSRFGKGFSKAARIGENDLLLVNTLAGKEAKAQQSEVSGAVFVSGFLFGIAGAAIAGGIAGATVANKQLKNKVCYILTSGANEKGRYDITLFEDKMMDKLLLSRDLIDLHNAYYAEKDKIKRKQAVRILPILMEAGIIEAEE